MTTAKFSAKTTAIEVVQGLKAKLDGKVVLITGVTSGIGIETARALSVAKAHVFITARDMARGKEVAEEIKRTTGNDRVEMLQVDLTSLESVRHLAEQFRKYNLPLNLLICNAGIMACPYEKTKDGFESQFGVNHLSHFLLFNLLLPELKAGKPARVIAVSSCGHLSQGINFDDINWEKKYDRWLAYGQSKTANILFAKQINKLYASEGIQAFALHPGGILTGLQKHIPYEQQKAMGWFKEDGSPIDIMKTVEQGASTTVYAALAPELDEHGGEYLEDCAISKGLNVDRKDYWGLAAHALDMDAAERLWTLSKQMVGLK